MSLSGLNQSMAQPHDYWQQKVEYDMNIDMDVESHQFKGKQELVYHNNSHDTLQKVFYHLYFNAFQPGSMMDVRSRDIEDPDPRVSNRIANLDEDEIGYIKVDELNQDGKSLEYEVVGTILEVKLDEPIIPNTTTTFNMDFRGQVPVQIRRSGRNNVEGIDYSMSQWYPKMAEYDQEGWHPDPYVAREFQGVFGEFDIKITIDSNYVLGGTGIVENPQKVGHGYQDSAKPLKRPDRKKLTWHFKASKVHDFMWAADPDYAHDTAHVPEGPVLHFLYQKDTLVDNWKKLQPKTVEAFQFMNKRFGEYPYQQYSVIQGGDGGMEYPMATLITGHRGFGSLFGVTAHELVHSWYQGVLATNENMYPWMDEGMTVYASNYITNHVNDLDRDNPLKGSYSSYRNFAETDKQEPMSLHADLFHTNEAYWRTAYSQGSVLVQQLGYIIGQDVLNKGMKEYYKQWKFKHPTPHDYKRVMERVSGIQLDWYFSLFINTTRTIDYGVENVKAKDDSTFISLKNHGKVPMPLDVQITFENGEQMMYYIPLELMRSIKSPQNPEMTRVELDDWPWPYPQYQFGISTKNRSIQSITIDPSGTMADVNLDNNEYPKKEPLEFNASEEE